MRLAVFLLLVVFSANAEKVRVIRCLGGDVHIPESNVNNYANIDVCHCLRKKWRGSECDIRKQKKKREREMEEINEKLIKQVLEG